MPLEGNCLFSAFHTEKPIAFLSFSNVNKGRKKVNKCKELKNKLNFMGCKAIIVMVIKKVTLLGIEPRLPAPYANTLPPELLLTI
jgi:hypothetical protein